MWLLLASAASASPDTRRTPVVDAVERATPAVVTIATVVQTQNPFSFGGSTRASSAGSGVIVDKSGVVLTNAHVVLGAETIRVHLSNPDRDFVAVPMAIEPELDLAVLRLEGASDLPVIAMGDSDNILLGETAIAIGNPYGLGLTVSTGVIGSIRRDVEVQPGLWQAYIQTDAAINPGNSGGALVNLDGDLIGINTAIRADAEGIGFAIPVNRARKVVDDVLSYGALRAPWLGLDATDVSPRRLAGTPWPKGAVLVDDVHPGGPAQRSGLQSGDLVVAADGRPVASRADLGSFLADRAPGVPVLLSAFRNSQPIEFTVKTEAVPPHIGRYVLEKLWQIEVAPVDGILMATTASGTGAWTAIGLRLGDQLRAVDGTPVLNKADVEAALGRAKARHRDAVLLIVERGPARASIRIDI